MSSWISLRGGWSRRLRKWRRVMKVLKVLKVMKVREEGRMILLQTGNRDFPHIPYFPYLPYLSNTHYLPYTVVVQHLSPLDGRYRSKTEALRPFFSEEALMKARVEVEIRYFMALAAEPLIRELPRLKAKQIRSLEDVIRRFSLKDALAI